ncbi:MAG: deoxyhypusine synthase family protein [Candidatus Micrarchaeota archaeon]|nr:deoxyhypusine synthase family protein [Candidatus Micrarchaeota archaeon]
MSIKGFFPSPSLTIKDYLENLKDMGLQATELYKAATVIRKMREQKATIFLTFTSNMVSSGLRDIFCYLAKEKKIDVIITSIGSIEEDILKTFSKFKHCEFFVDDVTLFSKGENRVGNILIPSSAYSKLEKVLQTFFVQELKKQQQLKRALAPYELIHDLGLYISDSSSFVYWCAKNNIPIFCPAPTDGAFGLQLYFFKQKHPEFAIDVSGDLKPLGSIVLNSAKTAGIILGGGVAKHHAIGANILREGFDYAVYISTSTEYDGSVSGAPAKEAKSWGKIKKHATVANVYAEASIVFPLLASIFFE